MSTDLALSFEGVSKRYARRAPLALDGLTCSFPRGAICGFVGPNGAGKTTAFSVVCGFLHPDAGKVCILGQEGFDPWRLKGRLGALPQDADLGDRHTPRELLRHLARLQGIRRREAHAEAERVLSLVRLGDKAGKRIGSLSHGMRRRVAVASALVGSPELVLLDEPTAGLDPVQSASLREALDQIRGITTLVVSSHNLDELERLCDWVVMVDKGRCLAQGTLAQVTGRAQVVVWELGPGEVPLSVLAEKLPEHGFRVEEGTLTQEAPGQEDLDASSVVVAGALAAAGVGIRSVRRGMSLERRFLADLASPSRGRPPGLPQASEAAEHP